MPEFPFFTLGCCVFVAVLRLPLVAAVSGVTLAAVHGLLVMVASLVAERRL